jgi:hypothetical protein
VQVLSRARSLPSAARLRRWAQHALSQAARITVRLNGVLVHENLELNKDFTTSAPLSNPLDGPTGPIYLQNHGDSVVYSNIWLVPQK